MNFKELVKTHITYKNRSFLTKHVLEARMALDDEVTFEPGQFANILVAEKTWRSYSIASLVKKQVELIVDIRPGGPGSIFFNDSKMDEKVECIIPMGSFTISDEKAQKLMVATGTGIVPYIPMVKKLLEDGFDEEIRLLWGIRYDEDYYIEKYLKDCLEYPNFKLLPAITRTNGAVKDAYKGRVTDLLDRLTLDLSKHDCYICGNPEMVKDVMEILKGKGASKISTEKY